MSFEIDIKRFTKKLNINAVNAKRKTVTAAYGAIMTEMRVDTGTARANWNVNIGNVDTTTRQVKNGATAKGQPITGTEEKQSGFSRTTMQIKAGKSGDIYISNSLPYIFKLEEKDHMVENTANNIKEAIENGALND